jgi:general secretion pathway protein J
MSESASSVQIHDRQEAGFTLVELLVAIVLLSLLSGIMLGSLQFGLKAWARGTAHADEVGNSVVAQQFLRRTLEEAYPFFTSEDPSRRRVEFAGSIDSLSFLAPAPAALGGGGRSRIALSVHWHDGRAHLMVSAAPELAGEAPASAATRLLAEVASVELAYFGQGRSDRAPAWHSQWRDEIALPQLVRVRVRFPAGDARSWPDLVVPTRIAVDVGCTYDPLSKRCRGR